MQAWGEWEVGQSVLGAILDSHVCVNIAFSMSRNDPYWLHINHATSSNPTKGTVLMFIIL